MSCKQTFLATVLTLATISSAQALESMADEALSGATGQDGITIGITPPALMQFSVVIHDTDGFTGSTDSGAFIFGDPYNPALGRTKSSLAFAGEVVMLIDATGDGNGAVAGTPPILRTNVSIPGVTIHTGDIYVADSDATGTLAGMQALSATASTPILNDMTITLGATTLNFELGNEVQGSMLRINTSMTGGLNVTGFALNDAGGAQTGGAIRTDLNIRDNGGANLTLVAAVDFLPAGMRVDMTQFGDAVNGADVRLSGLKFGNASANPIGNVDIIGLKTNSQRVTIAGH